MRKVRYVHEVPTCDWTDDIHALKGCGEPVTHRVLSDGNNSMGTFCEKHADAMLRYYRKLHKRESREPTGAKE